ncbi:hypothetical protein TNIN_220841 [Trichonephila inaurata madagascariensis]|uniref:Uncharacterized protein n=1 Tax=Trichonephila inaurata madagascariensis TaxID=2747483 RepID=A0A8X6YE99_9ARAC|nr:hypothetical protein TNIN_220841 [Trichonephila inaurata madagascariensis]
MAGNSEKSQQHLKIFLDCRGSVFFSASHFQDPLLEKLWQTQTKEQLDLGEDFLMTYDVGWKEKKNSPFPHRQSSFPLICDERGEREWRRGGDGRSIVRNSDGDAEDESHTLPALSGYHGQVWENAKNGSQVPDLAGIQRNAVLLIMLVKERIQFEDDGREVH